MPGGDWSGTPGHVCDVCGRGSENVGPRRGFDYANDVCGGCCDISSDDDGHNKEEHCRSCKRHMYIYKSYCDEVDNYCTECVGRCRICSIYFHPKYIDRYSVPLDDIIWNIIDERDIAEEVLGEDAKFGVDIIQLCKKCNKKWKRRKQQRKAAASGGNDAVAVEQQQQQQQQQKPIMKRRKETTGEEDGGPTRKHDDDEQETAAEANKKHKA